MIDINEVLADLRRRILSARFAIQGIAKIADLHKNTLRDLNTPGWAPSIHTIKALQKTLLRLDGMSEEELKKIAVEHDIHLRTPKKGK